MVEKHFTTDRALPGPDQWFSSDPAEFAELVRQVRATEVMLGRPELQPSAAEKSSRAEFRLSCIAARDLATGHALGSDDIAFRRPATGLPPSEFDALLGRVLVCGLRRGQPILWDHFAPKPKP